MGTVYTTSQCRKGDGIRVRVIFSPTWSPDRQRLAFATSRDGFNQIYVMQADGSEVQRLTDANGREEKPAWSPDAARIAFMSTRDGNAEVYVMNADGTDIRRITTQTGWDGQPSWSSQPFEASRPLLCPVTQPNGSRPLGEKASSEPYHGSGALWTVRPTDGILHVSR